MTSEKELERDLVGGGSKAMEEAKALTSLVSALAPLDQVARIRLLRTVSTFFEIAGADVYPDNLAIRGPVGTDFENKGVSQPSFSENRSLSPKAFMLEKRPQQDTERIACLAYYLTHYRDQPIFKTLDLSKLNTEAAQIKLSNPARAVDSAAAAHFLIPAGQGSKQLSAIGELYVQALPDRSAAKEAIASLKKKRVRVKSKISTGDELGLTNDLDENSAEGESDGTA